MRLSIVRAGRSETVDVDLDAKTVRLGERTYPFEVVEAGPLKVELEIAGEKVVVDGWPQGFASPPGPIDVNGERWTVGEVRRDGGTPPVPRTAPRPRAHGVPASPGTPGLGDGPGVPIVPPMPGKVIEVGVQEGDPVRTGQVLVVVEAMKMRNEVTSPIDGTVAQLSVRAGSNVRAKEAMLRVVPG